MKESLIYMKLVEYISTEKERKLVTNFMEKVTMNNDISVTVTNDNYKDHIVANGAGLVIMITNSGICHIFYKEVADLRAALITMVMIHLT